METAIQTGSSEICISSSATAPTDRAITVEDLTRILSSTVKHDDANKAITFLGMLLNYTEEDQINIGFLAESSTGKSYIPLELCQYFPEEDVMQIGYASPTSFFHDYARLVKTGSDKQRVFMVDLQKKILVFVDQPHDSLLQRLRSILSHDKKEIPLLITDRNKNKSLRTKHILVRGYPTVIFSSAKFSLSDQEKTRLLLLSPETTQAKLKESISLKIAKESNRQAYKETMQKNTERQFLTQRVLAVKKVNVEHIIIPQEISDKIREDFMRKHEKLKPRHQRDISRLLAMIKAHALLNFDQRELVDGNIKVAQEDVDAGFKLYESVSEANELGLSPELFTVFQKLELYIKETPIVNEIGITINDFQNFHEQTFYRKTNYDAAREMLRNLASMSLLIEEADFEDRRVRRYKLPQTNSEQAQ